MTAEDFTAFYPQFAGFTPAVVLSEYLSQANARFGDFGEDANEARRLYTAHKLTLWAITAVPSGTALTPTALAAAGKGQSTSQIASKKVGDVQVSYAAATSLSAKAATGLADLTETEYGLQLLTLLREHNRPRYIR
jgi:hypothetical protein